MKDSSFYLSDPVLYCPPFRDYDMNETEQLIRLINRRRNG